MARHRATCRSRLKRYRLLIVVGFLVGGLVFALASIASTVYESQYPILGVRWISGNWASPGSAFSAWEFDVVEKFNEAFNVRVRVKDVPESTRTLREWTQFPDAARAPGLPLPNPRFGSAARDFLKKTRLDVRLLGGGPGRVADLSLDR